MGVKKSTVCTSAVESPIRYTPASSAWSKPTRTFGSCCRANFPSTASSAAGLSLEAQPAALTDSVSRNGLVSGIKVIVVELERATDLRGYSQISGDDCMNPWRKVTSQTRRLSVAPDIHDSSHC